MLPALLCIFVSSDLAQTAAGYGGARVLPSFDEPLSEGRTTSLAATAAQKRLTTILDELAQTAAGYGGARVLPISDEPLSQGRTTSLAATAAQKRLITILDEPSGRIFTPLLALSCLLTVCSVYFRAESHLDPAEAEKLVCLRLLFSVLRSA
jgi:hypothetical protein